MFGAVLSIIFGLVGVVGTVLASRRISGGSILGCSVGGMFIVAGLVAASGGTDDDAFRAASFFSIPMIIGLFMALRGK